MSLSDNPLVFFSLSFLQPFKNLKSFHAPEMHKNRLQARLGCRMTVCQPQLLINGSKTGAQDLVRAEVGSPGLSRIWS